MIKMYYIDTDAVALAHIDRGNAGEFFRWEIYSPDCPDGHCDAFGEEHSKPEAFMRAGEALATFRSRPRRPQPSLFRSTLADLTAEEQGEGLKDYRIGGYDWYQTKQDPEAYSVLNRYGDLPPGDMRMYAGVVELRDGWVDIYAPAPYPLGFERGKRLLSIKRFRKDVSVYPSRTSRLSSLRIAAYVLKTQVQDTSEDTDVPRLDPLILDEPNEGAGDGSRSVSS